MADPLGVRELTGIDPAADGDSRHSEPFADLGSGKHPSARGPLCLFRMFNHAPRIQNKRNIVKRKRGK